MEISSKESINTLVAKSQRVLLKTFSVFPFDLFPDSVIVDENKLTIIKRIFFWSENIYTVPIKNILSVSVSSSPFFSTLSVEVNGLDRSPEPVNFIWHGDAAKIRRLVMGLIACDREKINITNIPDTDLSKKIEEIGALHISA